MGHRLDQTLALLNGLVGDYLSRSDNGLATPMALQHDGRPLPLDRAALARAHPQATPRIVLLVHGVMGSEAMWQLPGGGDYGSLLARDLGFTPFYVRYNSGRAVADSGAQLSSLLEALLAAYPAPLEQLVLLGYSMGGLVIRSACHAARLGGAHWIGRVTRAIYVGTPHLGAPAERAGRMVAGLLRAIPDPYTRLIADVADLRSDGIKDLGHADLRHEDRARARSLRDPRHPVPLLPEIAHYLVAGSLAADRRLAQLVGDPIVPVASATYAGQDAEALLPPERVKLLPGLSHLALAHHPDVYAQIKRWCEQGP